MAIMAMLKRQPLPKPELKIANSKVAELLDHMRAIQKLNQEIHDELLMKARNTPKMVVKLKPATRYTQRLCEHDPFLDLLLKK